MNEYPKPHSPGGQRTGRVESSAAGNVVEGLRGRQTGGVRPEAGGTAGFLTSVRNDQPGDADLNRETGDPSSSGNTTSTPYYYGYDVLGNVSVISGGDGQELDQFEQDAFGNLVIGNWVTRIGNITEQITTKQYDVDLGLYYFSARWYDPLVAVFASADDMSTGLQSSFVGHRPTANVDPTGSISILNVSSRVLYTVVTDKEKENKMVAIPDATERCNAFWKAEYRFIVTLHPGQIVTTNKNLAEAFPADPYYPEECYDIEGFYPSSFLRTKSRYYRRCYGDGRLKDSICVVADGSVPSSLSITCPGSWFSYAKLRKTGGYPKPPDNDTIWVDKDWDPVRNCGG